jgi:hypothetical protein
MAYFYYSPSSRTLWMFVFLAEAILFTATNIIVVLTAVCFDDLRDSTKNAKTPYLIALQQLAVCISGMLTMCLLCWRLAFWRWIGISHQRFWRIAPATLMTNSIWAGSVLAVARYGFIHGGTSPWLLEIYRKEVRPSYLSQLRTLHINGCSGGSECTRGSGTLSFGSCVDSLDLPRR